MNRGPVVRPSPEDRDRLRAERLAEVSRFYSPLAHFMATTIFGVGVVVLASLQVHHPSLLELCVIPLALVIANAAEWRIHKSILHERHFPFTPLYERHTPQHHMIYVHGDMAMREWKETRLVMIPAYGVLLIAIAIFPLAMLLWWLGIPNLGFLYMATSVGYVVLYEWLHVTYHLPEDHPISRIGFIKRLKNHHSVHHDPRLMQRYNFNVTFPVWDRVRGTLAPREAVRS